MTVFQALEYVRSRLAEAGYDEAESEARILVEELTGLDALHLRLEKHTVLSSGTEKKLTEAVAMRLKGVPLQYVVGRQEFMDRSFLVGEGVLIPRDDTEVAVRCCIERLSDMSCAEVLDLCSGSGIIAITIGLALPDIRVTAVEKEAAAFEYLTKNIALHNAASVRPLRDDIFTCHKRIAPDSLDLIVSNPPYIGRGQIASLQSEVLHEPVSALDGGNDGLDFYRCIACCWITKLKPGGAVVLEIGDEQAADVVPLLESHGVCDISVIRDIQGLDRAVAGIRNKG